MKDRTIVQRLKATLVLLVGLAVVAWFAEMLIANSLVTVEEEQTRLVAQVDRISYDMLQMSDALRGLLLSPTNTMERQRKLDADDDLVKAVNETRVLAAKHPELLSVLESIGEYDDKKLNALENQVMKLIETDPAAASSYYNTDYLPARAEQEKMVKNLMAVMVGLESKQVTQRQWYGLLVVVVTVVVGVKLGSSLVYLIQSPLVVLTEAMQRMSRGDFTTRVKLEENNEFGRLAAGLNQMADDLSALVGNIQKSGVQVNTSVTEIAATAREQQATSTEIAATTTEIGATSKEIAATTTELSKTVAGVSRVADQTGALAEEGKAGLARMEETMKSLTGAAGSISEKLAVMNERAAKINRVTVTMTKVADQTNLLSLNAAIEAEKAGEFGRGFSVVATEIRRLADQTAVASYDIERMVKEMQSAVSAGVMGMDKFSEEVRRSVTEVQLVGTQLTQIIHEVQALTPRFEAVNEGMSAQTTGAQQITDALVQLGEAANQTVESLRQSNMAIAQLNEAVGGMRSSVSRFKLQA
ncbi:MAG TPA: methyl-accepting chemotaxis protein [Roseimicrobium sp.]|nr:methyl-accepting chemotaxis protein [Roseimicrobium sp.]